MQDVVELKMLCFIVKFLIHSHSFTHLILALTVLLPVECFDAGHICNLGTRWSTPRLPRRTGRVAHQPRRRP